MCYLDELTFLDAAVIAGGGPHQDPPVRAGAHLPSGECVLRYQDWEGGVLRADSHQVWPQVNIRCNR